MKSSSRVRSLLSDVAITWQKMTMKGTKGEMKIDLLRSFRSILPVGKPSDEPVHIRASDNLARFFQGSDAYLVMLQGCPSRLNALGNERARGFRLS